MNHSEIWVLGHKIIKHNPSGNFDLVEGLTPANVPGPPPHYHAGFNEVFVVLEGKMEFMVNGETIIAKTGDSVDLPPNTVHTFNNASDEPCRWLNIHSPKGFLSFFESFGVNTDEEKAFEKSVHEKIIQQVMEQAGDYDMIIKT